MLDLKQKVNRNTKQIECMVHYPKEHMYTNTNVNEKSKHHPASMNKRIIKRFVDKVQALRDEQHLKDDFSNNRG